MSRSGKSPRRVVRWLTSSLLVVSLLVPALADAQQVVKIQVPYHSQIPPNDPVIPANWQYAEPGNAPIPNGFCTCACLDMLFNYYTGGSVPHLNPPLPQQEFAAVANTNDPMGLDGHWGTYVDDARRAVHFSEFSPAWPSPAPAYVPAGQKGYSWPLAIMLPSPNHKFGLVGIEGNWVANGWTRAQFKQTLALGTPIMINVSAAGVNCDPPVIDFENSSAELTGYDTVEETISGHSIVITGYNDNTNKFYYHDPTRGIGLMEDQDVVWDNWWVGKSFLVVGPWFTSVSVPDLGSFVPVGFQTDVHAYYSDPLPTQGTGVQVQAQGDLDFYAVVSTEITARLKQGQPHPIGYDQVVSSGDQQWKSFDCVTQGWGDQCAAWAETWGVVNAVAHSFPAGYTDRIGSRASDGAQVPRPVASDISIGRIPRGSWWQGAGIGVTPGSFLPGMLNDFSVEVENRGVLPATSVLVRLYRGDPCLAEFYPDPSMSYVGSAFVSTIPAGGTVLAPPIVFVPPTGNSFGQPYYNFVVEAECTSDPIHDKWVELDNNLASRAVHQKQIPPYTGQYLNFRVTNPFLEPCMVVTRIDPELPSGWTANVFPAGMDSVFMLPGETRTMMLAVDAMGEGIAMVDVYEDVFAYDDNDFVGRTGGLTFLVYTTGTSVPDGEDAVAEIALAPPSPNPASGEMTFSFALPSPGPATLAVYDLAGRHVADLLRGEAPAGPTVVHWDGRDSRGDRVASGVYFVKLAAGGEERVQKIVVMR
jgi:hypothetical protein